MSPDEQPHMAENEAPKEVEEPAQDAPLTMQQLAERAKAAWFHPIQTMVQAYARQGRIILAGILASLESDDGSKKKK